MTLNRELYNSSNRSGRAGAIYIPTSVLCSYALHKIQICLAKRGCLSAKSVEHKVHRKTYFQGLHVEQPNLFQFLLKINQN